MYNGNGNSYGSGTPRRGAGIPPLYIYIGVGILALLGMDHKKLTFQFQGRDFRLTDVAGNTDLVAKLRG